MARGWESKSVEEQQAEATVKAQTAKANLVAETEKARRRRELELQREHILSQRTSSPHRRTALETALADIEEKLGELGWTIHM
ncbi:hypothetical protein [Terriglobus tenax]|uniref:hypothetical protein n=1 Tax=Terriglobus tenax TaxID=1111115 RepID=UPI0021E0ECBF|nr:hypothetical protein [Terriglobus tenax]